MRALSLAALGTVLIGALVGCTTTDPGEPTSTTGTETTTPATGGPTSDSPTTSAGPGSGAPRVADPVETARFRDDPCLSLSAAQISDLGVEPPGKEEPAADGKACLWRNDQGGAVHLFWSNTRGLESVYQANARGVYELFKEIPDVGGLPAVVANQLDRRENGNCGVLVGTSDTTSFMVGLSQSGDKVGTADPCSVAADVADMVVTTIKEG
ncbi:DUF3558 domain-containing protein [Actinokineospora sp. 24-640]